MQGRAAWSVAFALALCVACSHSPHPQRSGAAVASALPSRSAPTPRLTTSPPARTLGGMPPVLDPQDLYAADRPGHLSPVVRDVPARVWVPNSGSDTVSVIDPVRMRVIRTIRVGRQPQHIVPSWDLKTLWVTNDKGNSLTPIDPATGRVGRPVPVHDPYNLYFTPNGQYAVVMASADRKIVFRDPHTMRARRVVSANCSGVNHADFSADGRYFIVSCEFSGDLLKVDTARQRIVAKLRLPRVNSRPQDVKIAPDGKRWYVADMQNGGVWVVDGARFAVIGFAHTGDGAHGLYVSRDSRYLYVTNRGEGSISRLNFRTGRLAGTWRLPHGGSPDMGGVSANGKVLWLSGRYDRVVYAISTTDGHLIRTIPVGLEPHGLCVYPQPGRYSLGHTGIMR